MRIYIDILYNSFILLTLFNYNIRLYLFDHKFIFYISLDLEPLLLPPQVLFWSPRVLFDVEKDDGDV